MLIEFYQWGVLRERTEGESVEEGLTQMSEHDEEALRDEVPDAALEAAASKCWEQAANPFTLAFCSGLDTCPSIPAR